MQHSSHDLERLLSAFYDISDCPFIAGHNGRITLTSTAMVLLEMHAPEEPTAEEVVDALDLPLTFVQAVLDRMDHCEIRYSRAWNRLTDVFEAIYYPPEEYQACLDRLLDHMWLRDMPDFEEAALAWWNTQPVREPNPWWTDSDTRPVAANGEWILR